MVCGTPDPKNYEKLYNNVGVSFINKKPRLESIQLQSGYEPHAASSILNWLEDEWASIYSKCFHVRFPFYFLLS